MEHKLGLRVFQSSILREMRKEVNLAPLSSENLSLLSDLDLDLCLERSVGSTKMIFGAPLVGPPPCLHSTSGLLFLLVHSLSLCS